MPLRTIQGVHVELDERNGETKIVIDLDREDTIYTGDGMLWSIVSALGPDIGTWTGQTLSIDCTPEKLPDFNVGTHPIDL